MKKILYLLIAVAAFTIQGCDTLDIKNTTSYDADLVWNDENLASAYVTNLYANTFGNWSTTVDNNSEQINGIPFYEGTITLTGSSYKMWRYTQIRSINDGLMYLEEGSIDQSAKNSLKAQMLFMRAYEYMKMVIYHGGVPYITKPQDKDADDLNVKRNSTKECYDLIIKDIDDAIPNLPVKISGSSSDYGRIDQCFAKAFKAKVLLYKASPQFNPTRPYDNQYWAEAYTAAKEAYDLCIANGITLTASYNDIWLNERGAEVIFAVINTYPNKTASWDNGTRPGSESRGSTNASPTWDMIKFFPMLDGKKFDDPTGKYYVGDEDKLMQRYWQNRDPRFASSIVWNGSIYEVSGKGGHRQYTGLGVVGNDDAFGYNPNAGVNGVHNDSYTGFFIRKCQDLSLAQSDVMNYDIDYIVMRFAEMMFIYAEAANETGHEDVALDMLKQIRKRAGIEPGDNGMYGISGTDRATLRQAILDERNVELCFEGHRFWDLRRTRNMMQLDGLTKYGIEAIAINADGTDMNITEAKAKAQANELLPENFRYVKWQVPAVGEKNFVVRETFYFFPIQQSQIDNNPNLEQNNNWGGTFNPTME